MRANASFLEAVSVAAGSIRGNKLRSFLTLLGIILATTTLIAVMSVIEGMNRYIAEHITDDLGADSFQIRRMVMIGQWDPKKWLEMQRRNPEMSQEEFQFVKAKAALSREIGMESYRGAPVQFGGERIERVTIQGASPNMGVIAGLEAAGGRFIVDVEDQRRMYVAFIGNDIKTKLYPNVDPVGKLLDIQGRRFEIVGVAKAKGSVFGESLDNFVVIPIETFFKIYGSRRGISYRALAAGHSQLKQAQDEIRMLLRAYRHVPPNQDDNFGIFTADSVVETWEKMTSAIAATAVAVVSVFMVVGGVVIMNIMLAVVTERTHEIGIRKSVGARRADILQQFLVESSLMAGTGGLLGVVLAWGVAAVVRATTPVPMALPASAVFVGVTLSAAVGLFFGIYPAQRAAKLDPIVALRAE
ncbi:MAG: FtsX-like permease family protein [Bryobacterales bacterium]|nr:FtsX-like permease family protein [Bryobacterales bacterium]